MATQYLFEKISELKEKFRAFFQHRKKITALENFSDGEYFPHKYYLSLVKACMEDGFLGDEESIFLDHMLKKYEVNYLDWSHRTKWIKQQINEKRRTQQRVQEQFSFNLEGISPSLHLPPDLSIVREYNRRPRL